MNRYKKSFYFSPDISYFESKKYFYIHKSALLIIAVECIIFS